MSDSSATKQQNDRPQSSGEGENYDAESKEDFYEPTGSEVNSFVFKGLLSSCVMETK